jgi:GNAT superfamily N-acetyltransferase
MCKLERLKVIESMQGKGIGRNMLQVIEDHARENGCERVSLTVHPDSDVQPFYERCGYEWSYIHECGATEMGKQL